MNEWLLKMKIVTKSKMQHKKWVKCNQSIEELQIWQQEGCGLEAKDKGEVATPVCVPK